MPFRSYGPSELKSGNRRRLSTVNFIMTCIDHMYTLLKVTSPLIKLKQFLLH